MSTSFISKALNEKSSLTTKDITRIRALSVNEAPVKFSKKKTDQ